MRNILFTACLALIAFHLPAQEAIHDASGCGTEAHHAWLMQSDPQYKAAFFRQKSILDSLKYAPVPNDRQSPPVYTIPVVVHVIHLGEQVGYQTNIPDQQILDAIEGLNERYANANGAGTDIEIQFCLATRDPNGCPTSGINRVDGSVIPGYREEGVTWDGTCGVDEVLVKDLSKWPTWEYYNIWVVHDICGSVAGYAYYPNGNEYDGTVIDIVSMTRDNGTLAHELGHGLNLKHTFSGDDNNACPANNDCLADGDEICDTPPHRTNMCGLNNPCTSEGDWLNSKLNWMSYCFPSETDGRFTPDQRTRMRNTMLVDPRAALIGSDGCANPERLQITSASAPLCRYDSRTLSAVPAGGTFQILDGSGYIQGNTLTVTGGTSITVAYVIQENDCTASIEQTLAVKPVPNSLLRSDADSLCIGQTTQLEGLPSGGTYKVISGPGSIDSITLTAEDEGLITLMYEKVYSGCFIRDTHEVRSLAVPQVETEMLADDILTAVPDNGNFQWLQCFQGYAPVPGATEATFQVQVSGEYAVVSSNGICSDTSDCVLVELTATHDLSHSSLKVFPNPVHDILRINHPVLTDITDLYMTDIRGRKIAADIKRSGAVMEINMTTLVSGVYVLVIQSKESGKSVFRIVKE